MEDSILLNLSNREVEVIRQALRAQEQNHKRNDFKLLKQEVADLLSHISNEVIVQKASKEGLTLA